MKNKNNLGGAEAKPQAPPLHVSAARASLLQIGFPRTPHQTLQSTKPTPLSNPPFLPHSPCDSSSSMRHRL